MVEADCVGVPGARCVIGMVDVVVVPVGAGGMEGAEWLGIVVVVVPVVGMPPVGGMPGMVVAVLSAAGTAVKRRADAAASGESTPPISSVPNRTLVAPQRMARL